MNIFVLLTGLCMIAGGIFLLWREHDSAMAWSTVLFGVACAVIAAWDIRQSRSNDIPTSSSSPGRTMVVYARTAHWAVYTLACGSFALAGLLMATSGYQPVVGCLTAGFFGPGALILLWQILDRRPRLIIDADGIFDRTLGLITWSDIEWASLHSINGNDFISLAVRDPMVYLNRMSFLRRRLALANRSLGFSEVNLNLAGVTVSPEEVLQLILRYVIEHKQANGDEDRSY